MKLNRENVVDCLKGAFTKIEVLQVNRPTGQPFGSLEVDTSRFSFSLTKNHRVRCKLDGQMTFKTPSVTFYPHHFWIDLTFTRRNLEDVKQELLQSMGKFILTSFTRIKSSAPRSYYHFDSIDGILPTRNGAENFPIMQRFNNVLNHHRAMLDYIRGTELEASHIFLGMGHLICLLNHHHKVASPVPEEVIETLIDFLEPSEYANHAEHYLRSENSIILRADMYKGNDRSPYSTNTFVLEKRDDVWIRSTKDKSRILEFFNKLTS